VSLLAQSAERLVQRGQDVRAGGVQGGARGVPTDLFDLVDAFPAMVPTPARGFDTSGRSGPLGVLDA